MSSNYNGHNPYLNGNKTSKKRHCTGPNPFTAPENQAKFNQTLHECNRLKHGSDGSNPTNHIPNTYNPYHNHTHSKPMPPHPPIINMANNPYLNDPVLLQAMQQYSPFKNQSYEQTHSVRTNGQPTQYNTNYTANSQQTHHTNPNFNNTPSQNRIYTNTNYKRTFNGHNPYIDGHPKPKQMSEESRTIVTDDNPYHPTNYYKECETEQTTARALVHKYRVDSLQKDAVTHEYSDFCHHLPSMNMISEANDNTVLDREECKYESFRGSEAVISPQSSHSQSTSEVSDSIPGQIRVNKHNFETLGVGDSVWIRNDICDWEIFTVVSMERHSKETVLGTFVNGAGKERVIWKEQCSDYVMAKFMRDERLMSHDRATMDKSEVYKINNIFRIDSDEFKGNFVLKQFESKTLRAQMKDVKTGKMVELDLASVKHQIV